MAPTMTRFLTPFEFFQQPKAKRRKEQPNDNIIKWTKSRNECQSCQRFYNHGGNLTKIFLLSSVNFLDRNPTFRRRALVPSNGQPLSMVCEDASVSASASFGSSCPFYTSTEFHDTIFP